MSATCPVTTIVTAFEAHGVLFRCDREPDHDGQHHGQLGSGTECFWGSEVPVFVECPLCHDPERGEDKVAGVCLTCADAIAFAQNQRRGAIEVRPS